MAWFGPRTAGILDSGMLAQRSSTTCGVASLIAAYLVIHEPAAEIPDEQKLARLQRQVAGWLAGGRREVGWVWPWPRALGTSPWSLAAGMRLVSGRGYRVVWIRPGRRADEVLRRVRVHTRAGSVVPMYVGSRWLPRHVVLALPVTDDQPGLNVFEPGQGRTVAVDPDAFAAGSAPLGGWRRLWAVLLPQDGRSA